MTDSVWCFFYGGIINRDVMKRLSFQPECEHTASVLGFELRISPLVNLVPSPNGVTFGRLMRTTHGALEAVYSQLQARYLPYPVVATGERGWTIAALCYRVPDMPSGRAEASHVQPLLTSAIEFQFPDWYVEKIRSFITDE